MNRVLPLPGSPRSLKYGSLVEAVIYPGEEHVVAGDLLEQRTHIHVAVNEGFYFRKKCGIGAVLLWFRR
jgi:hypothetical protein